MTPAAILRRAADGFRTGEIRWGRGEFIRRDDSCRCTLGGIAWAADPADPDGDPRWVSPDVRLAAQLAVDTLADYLVDELGAIDCGPVEEHEGRQEWHRDPVETCGDWNDTDIRELPQVIAALEAAAAYAERAAA